MVNLELLKQIQDLKESGQILELKDPNTGKLDDRLLSEVYHLYYNGHLHLPEYHETLGFKNHKYLKKSFIRRGWKTLSVKEVQQVYRSEIQDKIRKTNLERYGVECAFNSHEIQDKIRKTNLERYGCENPSQSPEIREKVKKTNLERYGYENVFKSDEVKSKIKQTNLERYGYSSPLSSPEIREKVKQTNIERYGVENPSQSPAIREKVKKTNLERYGYENVFKSPEIKERVRRTNLERYGYPNAYQSPVNQEKYRQTNIERYGYPYASQSTAIREKLSQLIKSPGVQEKMKQTNLERYGCEFVFQSQVVQEKIRSTNIGRYGYPYASQNPDIQDKIKIGIKETRKSNDSRYAKLEYLVDNDQDKVHEFVYKNYTNQSKVLKRYGLYQENLSTPEAAIREILEKHKVEYLFEYRPKFMEGKELDFFIPNKNLAIEVNGLYWHSTKFRDKFYHQDKHLRCRSEGIQLLSFTEDQILEKLEIIESMILHKLGLTPYRLYAKNCTIRELRTQEAKDFLEKNHLHGWAVGQICYALEYDGKIVHAMSFGNNRFKRSNHPELIRSASLRFHSVAGGFQRLLKYYKRTYKVDLVESYVDFNISNGQSYELASRDLGDLGNSSVRETVRETVRDNLTSPDLWFVFRGKRYYRQKFMKHNLHKIFNDFPRRSEEGYKEINASEYLRDRGVLEYYGAGNLKYLI